MKSSMSRPNARSQLARNAALARRAVRPQPGQKDVLLTDLIEWRNDLEHAWSDKTAHPSYTLDPPLHISAGQCGVTSFWLREILDSKDICTRFVRGALYFPTQTAPILDHCWLERQQGSDSWIIDLTLDQTGWIDQILLEPRSVAKKRGLRYEGATGLKLQQLQDDPTIVRRLIHLKWNLEQKSALRRITAFAA